MCLGCFATLPDLFTGASEIRTLSQDILCPDLPIYKDVTAEISCQCCSHGLSIAVGIADLGPCFLQIGHCVHVTSLYLVQYASNGICLQALPTNSASLTHLQIVSKAVYAGLCSQPAAASHASVKKCSMCVTSTAVAVVTWHQLQLLLVATNLLIGPLS